MKKILFVLALVSYNSLIAGQNADSIWIVNNYSKIERQVPMRDGVKLFTSIYVPDDNSENHPILITRTPYSCAPYGKTMRAWWNSYLKYYLREGYIMITQDVRGRWMSEGEFVNIRPFNPDKKTIKILMKPVIPMMQSNG